MKQLVDLIVQQIETDSLWPAEHVAGSLLREMCQRWPQINDTTRGEIVPFASRVVRGVIIPIGEDRITLEFVSFGARWSLDEDFVVLRAAYLSQNDTLYIERQKAQGY